MRVHGLIPLIAAIASFSLAVLVYGAAPDRRLGRVFGFLSFTLVFWNLIFFALYSFPDYDTAFTYSRLFRTIGVFFMPAVLHLSLVLPDRRVPLAWITILVFDYAVSGILAYLSATDRLVTQLATYYWGYYSVGTHLYIIFTLSLALNFVAAVLLLVREYRTTTDPRMRLQLKFWLFGMAVALPLGLTNLLPIYGIRFYPLGNLASALWAGIVGYAIVRHRLMDIEVVVTKGLAYIGVSCLVVGPITGLLLALQRWAFGEIHYDFTAAVVLLFIGVGVLFPRVHSMAERLLGQSLFRSKFAAHATLDALASEVVRVLDRQKLIVLLCERIGEAFGIEQIALYLRDGSSGALRIRHEIGDPLLAPNLERDHWLVRRLSLIEEVVLREEIEGQLPTDQAGIARDHLGWAVAVPFHSGRELIGFLCLGPKKRLEAFSSGDLSILGRVAAEASIALQNARLFEELRQSRAIISRAGRLSAIGTLAAGIAHEIRNPLVSIQTFFQLAPQRLNDEEFMTSFLKLAEAEVQRIGNLISELLLFAKSPTPTLRTVSIGEIAERAVILLEPQARTQGIKLTLIAEPESAGVLADGDQLMQVVLNLGLNAIQATPRGGEVTVETRPVSQDGTSYCQLEIRDTGQGIPDALRDAIFDPFFTTKDKGTGLGLSIAHQIVAECGGHISVVSEEGVGSRFVVNLPAEDSELGQDPVGRASA